MASVNVRNNYLYFDFRFLGIRCRESTLLNDTPGNRRKMKHIANKIDAEITMESFEYKKYFPNSSNIARLPKKTIATDKVKHSFPLFNTFASKWFIEMKIHWRKSTYDTHLSAFKAHIENYFLNKFIHEVSKQDILHFRHYLIAHIGKNGKPLSTSRINHIVNPLRMILAEASEQHEITNPFKNIKALRVPKTHIDIFTPNEIKRIVNHIRQDYKAYVITKFYTGLRSGEVHALQWQHIDFENNLIQIRKSYVRGEIIDPKTEESIRDVCMTPLVRDSLQTHYGKQKKPSGFVFTNANNSPIDNNGFRKCIWYPLLRHLGIKLRTPYQTRHTAATLMLASGESPEWIARQLGHSSTEMLFKVYSRYVQNIKHNDGENFSNLIQKI